MTVSVNQMDLHKNNTHFVSIVRMPVKDFTEISPFLLLYISALHLLRGHCRVSALTGHSGGFVYNFLCGCKG